MLRKLIALALLAAGAAAIVKKRSADSAADEPASAPAPASEPSAPAAQTEAPSAPEPAADDLAHVRPGQTDATVEAPIAGVGDDAQSAIPDVSDDDPLVREAEQAAAADAGSIGGEADTVTADTPPEMRPVVEGAGDAPETFETTEEQGR